MPSYATPTDVIRRYDIRRLSQFLSDTGTPVCTKAQIEAGTCAALLAVNTNLLEAIKDASGKILTACRVANRYLQADLDAVYADSDKASQLIRVTCDLTFGLVMMRRGLSTAEITKIAPGYREALDFLTMLERGLRVFDDAPPPGTDAPTAGVTADVVGAPGSNPVTINSTPPPYGAFWTQQCPRLFPGPNRGGYC